MKRIEFTCDACHAVSHCDVPPSGNVADYMLDGWTANRIMLEENGERVIDVWAELCPSCADNLRAAMDMSSWTKPDSVVQFPKVIA